MSALARATPGLNGSWWFSLHTFSSRLLLQLDITSSTKMGTTTPVPPLSRDMIRSTWAPAAKRNTRGQSEPAGTYSLVSLFSLLSSSSHSSSFWSSCLPRSAAMNWAGPDVTNPGGDRNAGLDGGGKGCVFCCFFSLVCLLSSVLLPSLLFFYYNDLFLRGVQNIV